MSFPDAARIRALHASAIEAYGGGKGELLADCVERSVGAAANAVLYADDESLPFVTMAAYLLVYLAHNHCFQDGNKRVAWMALVDCLLANGFDVVATQQEAIDLVLDVVQPSRCRWRSCLGGPPAGSITDGYLM